MLSFMGRGGRPRLAKSVYLFRRRQITGVNLCGILGDRGKWWMMGLMEKHAGWKVFVKEDVYTRVSRQEKELGDWMLEFSELS